MRLHLRHTLDLSIFFWLMVNSLLYYLAIGKLYLSISLWWTNLATRFISFGELAFRNKMRRFLFNLATLHLSEFKRRNCLGSVSFLFSTPFTVFSCPLFCSFLPNFARMSPFSSCFQFGLVCSQDALERTQTVEGMAERDRIQGSLKSKLTPLFNQFCHPLGHLILTHQ